MLAIMPSENKMKQIEVNKMIIKWESKSNELTFEVFAPTTGWVAIGFNSENNIVGTNLIMGASIDNNSMVEEQYVVAAGVHKPIALAGGEVAISDYRCIEDKKGTTLKFSISQKQLDKFHYSLTEGTKIWLVCAYSQEDDFNHHSIMRQHVEVTL
jgi:DOMON domain